MWHSSPVLLPAVSLGGEPELTHTLQTQSSGERGGFSEVAADTPVWKIETQVMFIVPEVYPQHYIYSAEHITCISLLFCFSLLVS